MSKEIKLKGLPKVKVPEAPKMKRPLNKEQIAILEHTSKTCMLYCGDSEDMSDLCDKGLMKFMGRKSFVKDGYYRITREGSNVTRN